MLRAVLIWGLAGAVTLLFAANSSIGPVLWIVRPGNGLHYTDVAFGAMAAALAFLVTAPRQDRD